MPVTGLAGAAFEERARLNTEKTVLSLATQQRRQLGPRDRIFNKTGQNLTI